MTDSLDEYLNSALDHIEAEGGAILTVAPLVSHFDTVRNKLAIAGRLGKLASNRGVPIVINGMVHPLAMAVTMPSKSAEFLVFPQCRDIQLGGVI